MSTKKRIAKNTLMLYFRQFVAMFIALYTVRVVLDVLGAADYGLYNVIGGFVAMFAVLSSSLGMAAQRFTAFALGEKDELKLKRTFSTNLVVYLVIAAVTYLLLKTGGQWYVSNRLEIPADRYESLLFVYQFSILSFVVQILSTPFRSSIMAHEDMQIFAYLSIFEAVLKLLVVWLLALWGADKLEVYGVLLFCTSVISSLSYIVISIKKYTECTITQVYWSTDLFKSMISFSGWSLFGQLSTMFRMQAVTILINQNFNPVVVAARAIAINITSKVSAFSNNFMAGLNPPIIKAYAANKMDEFYNLIYDGSRISFFLMWVISLPLILEMDFILGLWLKEPPQYSSLFTALSLGEVLILSISMPLASAARAPGKMKNYELILGCFQFLVFGLSWLVFKNGGDAYMVYVVAIAVNIAMFLVRLILVNSLTGLPVKYFITKVFIPMLGVAMISVGPGYLTKMYLGTSLIAALVTMMVAVVSSSIGMYYLGLTKERRSKVNVFIGDKLSKIKR